MTDELIKEMARRFLSWRLPADFAPDGGISFQPMFKGVGGTEFPANPTGTNLFTAAQAEAMVRHMIGAAE